jgi:hypothetical protein
MGKHKPKIKNRKVWRVTKKGVAKPSGKRS